MHPSSPALLSCFFTEGPQCCRSPGGRSCLVNEVLFLTPVLFLLLGPIGIALPSVEELVLDVSHDSEI